VCCAAAHKALEVLIREGYMEMVQQRSDLFAEGLKKLSGLIELRRCGLLIALDLGNEERVQELIRRCLDNGILLDWFLFNPRSIRIAPPLIITEDEIAESCETILRSASRL
jgi:acetylornithine/succinyldiaminopimelate/putrescine aminotransferase